ncbi:MAG TPA: DedA family protein [Candidatus Saccharimonadales bacterium]|nr:DedA family protein [Candidatus Saccharimonadales bacterium]
MFNVHDIVQTGGILAVAAIIFAESGLLLGFFLPGDTLLLTAGLFAGQDKLPLWWLMAAVIIAAIVGYQVGYHLGERIGPRLFKRKDGILFREDYIGRTREFLDKYGPATVVLARFIAHVRTFISVIAGAGQMNRATYFFYNVVGAVLWGGGVTLLGYLLGSEVPNIDRFFFPVIVALLIAIYIITVWQLGKDPKRRATLKKGLKEDWDYFFKNKNT